MYKQHKTFFEYTHFHHNTFSEKLRTYGKSEDEIERIRMSGYYLPEYDIYGNGDTSYFLDSFYGGYDHTSRFGFNGGLLDENEPYGRLSRDNRIVSKIRSIQDAFEAIEKATNDLNPEIAKRICFRGECRKHTIRRSIPNPYYSYSDGSELLMLPSYWRQFKDSGYMDRPLQAEYRTTLGMSMFSDMILYDGIDVKKLIEYNYEKYGDYTMSDLEDFPEPENQELYRRYLTKMDHVLWSNECVSLEQHYGFQTTHLDVTFDLPTAIFFALNKFTYLDRNIPSATYTLDDRIDSEPTVFCFLFPRQDVYYERDMITGYNMFDATPPLRPLQQKCSVFRTDAMEINWAAKHVILELKLERDFNSKDIPTYDHLFPPPEHDLFYAKLLEQKKRHHDVWKSVIEYK
ncbi:MAG: hypothetical protein FWC72_02510 [Oscillospiraceae bacterium]|nr:hypothetical protein [Oscillospiraceae bacterium]